MTEPSSSPYLIVSTADRDLLIDPMECNTPERFQAIMADAGIMAERVFRHDLDEIHLTGADLLKSNDIFWDYTNGWGIWEDTGIHHTEFRTSMFEMVRAACRLAGSPDRLPLVYDRLHELMEDEIGPSDSEEEIIKVYNDVFGDEDA